MTGKDASSVDLTEHEHTYDLFIRLVKWSLGLSIAILVLMAATLL